MIHVDEQLLEYLKALREADMALIMTQMIEDKDAYDEAAGSAVSWLCTLYMNR